MEEWVNLRKVFTVEELEKKMDMYAKDEGFHDFNYLRTLTQSIGSIHKTYVDSIFYVLESLADDGLITINKKETK